jgi:hypothetical protein
MTDATPQDTQRADYIRRPARPLARNSPRLLSAGSAALQADGPLTLRRATPPSGGGDFKNDFVTSQSGAHNRDVAPVLRSGIMFL